MSKDVCGIKRFAWLCFAFAWASYLTTPAAGGENTLSPAPVIERMIIQSSPLQAEPPQSTQQVISAKRLERARPLSLADTLDRETSVSIQTNSRGETLAFVRNSGERQLAVFFDGAALNVPWDNRLDLSLFPVDGLNGVALTAGAASVRYGPNTAGGVIELIPTSATESSDTVRASLQSGVGGLVEGSGRLALSEGNVDMLFAVGGLTRNGEPLSGEAELEFAQDPLGLRTNTDTRRVNALARIAAPLGERGEIAASVLYVDAAFGIAPEGRNDPATAAVRFWRFPATRQLVGVLNTLIHLSPSTDLEAAFWVQDFTQTIESFTDVDFAAIEDIEIDDDLSIGARLIATSALDQNTFRLSVNALGFRHRQRDIAFGVDGQEIDRLEQMFRDVRLSVGAEFERVVGEKWSFLVGASGDLLTPQETGVFADPGDFLTANVIAGAVFQASDRWQFRFAGGSKTRLPTPRELFGTAINRFLANPDLKAERVNILEAEARFTGTRGGIRVIPFAQIVGNTIDQQNVVIGGDIFRQRINLRGSRVLGVELIGSVEILEGLSASTRLTATRTRRRDEPGAPAELKIAERPSLIARLDVDYDHTSGFGASAELEHRGRAFSFTDESRFEPLPRSTAFNLEARFDFARQTALPLSLFLRVDNVGDILIEPQLGLPAPGRLIRGGLRASF
ncbi:MAG: TonB-dependent receptor [Pseudomonadota bacterium]